MATRELRVEVQQQAPGVVVVRCLGDLCFSTADDLREAIQWSLTPDLELLRLDLTGVTQIGPAGVRCLELAWQRCEELGVVLEINAGYPVRRALDDATWDMTPPDP
jgi:anti-anti-sigma regulatory factor